MVRTAVALVITVWADYPSRNLLTVLHYSTPLQRKLHGTPAFPHLLDDYHDFERSKSPPPLSW